LIRINVAQLSPCFPAHKIGEPPMNVSDIMTREVASISPDARLEDAVRLMVDRKISGVPVVENDGAVVGMITEGDLLRRAEIGTEGKSPGWFEMFFLPGTSAYDYVRTHGRKVEMLMTGNAICVSPQATLASAVTLMRDRHVKRLPVIHDGRLVGILSRADVMKALVAALHPDAPLPDSEIKKRLDAELAKQLWFPRAQVKVTVSNGVAEFCGTIADIRHREALQVIAETVGARAVSDKLVCIEPISGALID
jgi:CBS domain-containing protein